MMAALESVTFLRVPGDGVSLNAVVAGPPGGKPVVLLHGFPEFWYGWHHQIPVLAGAGFRVVALDQRGYNTSDKPPSVRDYTLDRLTADVLAALDHLGMAHAAIVGHDWGGIVAWRLALTRPDRVTRLAILNAPHPTAFLRVLASDPGQMLRSWYVLAWQLPRLPEWALGRNDFEPLVKAMRASARPDTFTDADFARYREAWRQSGALTAMLNWYRAIPRGLRDALRPRRIRVPTLILWGERDRFLQPRLARVSAEYCDDVRLHRFSRATHWVQHEEPEQVGNLLIEFLTGGSGTGVATSEERGLPGRANPWQPAHSMSSPGPGRD